MNTLRKSVLELQVLFHSLCCCCSRDREFDYFTSLSHLVFLANNSRGSSLLCVEDKHESDDHVVLPSLCNDDHT